MFCASRSRLRLSRARLNESSLADYLLLLSPVRGGENIFFLPLSLSLSQYFSFPSLWLHFCVPLIHAAFFVKEYYAVCTRNIKPQGSIGLSCQGPSEVRPRQVVSLLNSYTFWSTEERNNGDHRCFKRRSRILAVKGLFSYFKIRCQHTWHIFILNRMHLLQCLHLTTVPTRC